MPIYGYACENCRHEFETLILKTTDEEPTQCPSCGGGPIKRDVGGEGVYLKGKDLAKLSKKRRPKKKWY